MSERAPELTQTGISGLDEIFLGGIAHGNVVLIEGPPGSGKTTLGLEFIYRGATEFEQPGLVVSFELTPQKLLHDAAGFGWDFASLQDAGKVRLITTSPNVLLAEMQSEDSVLMAEIERIGAKRILIDGLTPLRLASEHIGAGLFREHLQLMIDGLRQHDCITLLTRELPTQGRAPLDFGHEEFLCDTLLSLGRERAGLSTVRSLEVYKSRGQSYIMGRHTLRIHDGRGIEVYRRAQAKPIQTPQQPTSTRRTSIGIEALNDMLGGGIYDGSVTLVVGISGTGKTVLGTQFLAAGAGNGERGLMVSLDEHPAQIVRNAEGLKFGFERCVDSGDIVIHYETPYELELDVHFRTITDLIERHGIKRVLIDSIAAYRHGSEADFHHFVYALTTYLKNRLITAVYSFESPELLGVSQISEELKASTIVDNIVLLNYVEIANRLRRAITVPKARGSAPHRDTREYVIRPGGIDILTEDNSQDDTDNVPQLPFSAYYGLLSRSPARRSPIIEERIAGGEDWSKPTATDDDNDEVASSSAPKTDG